MNHSYKSEFDILSFIAPWSSWLLFDLLCDCRLLVTHYPHLCLVEDWLEDSLSLAASSSGELMVLKPPTSSGVPLSQAAFRTGQSASSSSSSSLSSIELTSFNSVKITVTVSAWWGGGGGVLVRCRNEDKVLMKSAGVQCLTPSPPQHVQFPAWKMHGCAYKQ